MLIIHQLPVNQSIRLYHFFLLYDLRALNSSDKKKKHNTGLTSNAREPASAQSNDNLASNFTLHPIMKSVSSMLYSAVCNTYLIKRKPHTEVVFTVRTQ